jgi:hypothetical protein
LKAKVSCPFTGGTLIPEHEGWCVRARGEHCNDKACRWKIEPKPVEAKKVTQQQKRLF